MITQTIAARLTYVRKNPEESERECSCYEYFYEVINNFEGLCTENNFLLNVNKIKELIIDFKKEGGDMHSCYYQRS